MITREQHKHLKKVVKLLIDSPEADVRDNTEEELQEYLEELIVKHGDLLHGIIIALERELEK